MSFFDFGKEIEKDTEFVIFGIPWDYCTSIDLPNSEIAPKEIRNATRDIALSTELCYEIPQFKAADLGDVKIERTNIEKNLKEIENFLNNSYRKKKTLFQ